jgi:hypothetical protein
MMKQAIGQPWPCIDGVPAGQCEPIVVALRGAPSVLQALMAMQARAFICFFWQAASGEPPKRSCSQARCWVHWPPPARVSWPWALQQRGAAATQHKLVYGAPDTGRPEDAYSARCPTQPDAQHVHCPQEVDQPADEAVGAELVQAPLLLGSPLLGVHERPDEVGQQRFQKTTGDYVTMSSSLQVRLGVR